MQGKLLHGPTEEKQDDYAPMDRRQDYVQIWVELQAGERAGVAKAPRLGSQQPAMPAAEAIGRDDAALVFVGRLQRLWVSNRGYGSHLSPC